MDIRKVLLVKFLTEFLTVTGCLCHKNKRKSVIQEEVEGTSEKLRHTLKSLKITSTFYNESTLHTLLCKPKDRRATI